jgi:hypothetical protein
MQRTSSLDMHLQGNAQSERFRKRFATRLDMTMKRAKITSRIVAGYLGVREQDVTFWRAGITLPQGAQCRRLSQLLSIDLAWLCLAPASALRT